MAQTASESGAIANNVSDKINSYSKKLRGALDAWNDDNQKIKDLFSQANLGDVIQAIKILQSAAKPPPSGTTYNTISGAEGKAFYELAKGLSQTQLQTIKITGYTIKYKDSDGKTQTISYSNVPGTPSLTMQPVVNAIDALEHGHGVKPSDILSISIEMTPKQANNNIGSIELQLAREPGALAKLQQAQQIIAQTQSDERNDMLQIMYFFNAMKSNQKSLSSILKTLNSIAEAGFRSVS